MDRSFSRWTRADAAFCRSVRAAWLITAWRASHAQPRPQNGLGSMKRISAHRRPASMSDRSITPTEAASALRRAGGDVAHLTL
jgi:hypothetical protein